jgi:hypothetical protein
MAMTGKFRGYVTVGITVSGLPLSGILQNRKHDVSVADLITCTAFLRHGEDWKIQKLRNSWNYCFWTFTIVQYSTKQKTRRFGSWMFPSSGEGEDTYSLRPLRKSYSPSLVFSISYNTGRRNSSRNCVVYTIVRNLYNLLCDSCSEPSKSVLVGMMHNQLMEISWNGYKHWPCDPPGLRSTMHRGSFRVLPKSYASAYKNNNIAGRCPTSYMKMVHDIFI